MAHALRIRLFAGVLAAAAWAASACGDDATGDGDASAGEDGGGRAGRGGSAGRDADAGTADAATGDAAAAGECADSCTCDQDETCEYTCAADCTVECLGAICTTDCPEGGCTLDADFEANATYSCSGGGCSSDCDNGSSCALDCSGGGCDVTCDVDSTCTVDCSGRGDACTVTCENGGRATCEGACEMVGCDQSCEPDPTYTPMIDPADFSTTIDNPLFPLPVGAVWEYEGPDELITVTVLEETYMTEIGVECVVVHDQVRSPDTGEVLEDTNDWYAQDSEGNVWYMGEDTAEYLNGMVATTAGSWEAGVDGALPGIVMQAMPEEGQIYRQEYYACEAEDMGEVVAVGESVTVPTGTYTDCVRTRDYTPLEPSSNEYKTYCPGIGTVLAQEVSTGERTEELTSVMLP